MMRTGGNVARQPRPGRGRSSPPPPLRMRKLVQRRPLSRCGAGAGAIC